MNSIYESVELFKEKGFGKSIGVEGNLCLIVVDIINGFTDPNMPMGVESAQQIENINRFIDVCRDHKIPIVLTTIEYEDSSLPDGGLWIRKMEGLKTLMAGTHAVEIDERVHIKNEDSVLKKKYASAFFGTDLSSRLYSNKIDTLIVVGSTTSGCVRATVVDAIQLGFRPIVLSDCVGDRWKEAHDQSLYDMQQKYADVLTSNEVADLINTINEKGVESNGV